MGDIEFTDVWEYPESWKLWESSIEFYGNPAEQWLIAVLVALFAAFLFRLLNEFLARRAKTFSQRTRSELDDSLAETMEHTRWWFLLVVAIFCGTLLLQLREKPRDVIRTTVILTLLLQIGVWGNVLITAAVSRYINRKMQFDPASVTTISALALIGKLVLYSLLLLLALDNLGINVTALIAGLGVGGIAVALAVQNILGDLLASLSIVFDRPFVLGDFIVVGEQAGNVEKIGIKTTRLRSLSGEQLIFSNNDLLQSRIRNYKRMYERRIVFSIGVTYGTSRKQLKQIPEMMREIIEAQNRVRFDRSHFQSFGDFSLVFETVYYVLTPDYNVYMDAQHAINLKIFEQFEDAGIEFAFPTRTLYVQNLENNRTQAEG